MIWIHILVSCNKLSFWDGTSKFEKIFISAHFFMGFNFLWSVLEEWRQVLFVNVLFLVDSFLSNLSVSFIDMWIGLKSFFNSKVFFFTFKTYLLINFFFIFLISQMINCYTLSKKYSKYLTKNLTFSEKISKTLSLK